MEESKNSLRPALPTDRAQNRTGRVLVIGGSGFYGQYLIADLLKHSRAEITIASRNPQNEFAGSGRVGLAKCDLNDLAQLTRLAADHDILVHCAGPFQRLPLNPLRAAIAAKCHYVDLAEDRAYSRAVRALAPQIESAGIAVFSGASVCPAMEGIVAGIMQPRFERLTSIRTFAAPDTCRHRGPAMFHTMLWGVGLGWDQPVNGEIKRVHGWTQPEWIEFPPPVGKRLTFLVLEMANLDLHPEMFGVSTVAFKAGTEHAWLNRTLNLAARFRAFTGFPRWERFGPFVRALSWIAGRFGRDEGGVIFEIGGIKDGRNIRHHLAFMANKDGGFIPSALAAMVTGEILAGKVRDHGIVPLRHWIEPDTFLAAMQQRGILLWKRESSDQPWKQIHATAVPGG